MFNLGGLLQTELTPAYVATGMYSSNLGAKADNLGVICNCHIINT